MDPAALLSGLDDAQREAVTSPALPLVVLAPAGSGKTRVLTRRIAYRVATGEADPRRVLALTFTRRAAGELTTRLGQLGLRSEATAGTFHAVAWGVLRSRWVDQRREPPTLLDRKARILSELAPKVPGRERRQVTSELAGEIEWAKARMVSPAEYPDAVLAAGRRPPLRSDLVASVFEAYEQRKQRGRLVDFDDLLALCAHAVENDETFATAQRWRFRHLFVDELQDVNPLQFRLLEAWRGDQYDVTAVGDPQQAIYGWNGSDAAFLLDIHRHWPPAEVVQLTRSYRSTPQILGGAARVLRGARQPAQSVEATRPDGDAIALSEHADEQEEARAIVRALRRGHAPGRPWSDQAVLVRTHAQATVLAEALRLDGIPHRLRGGAAFLDRPEVRQALRHLRSANAPLGTALADLAVRVDEMRADEVDVDRGDPAAADPADSLTALVQMGRDYMRLDPLAAADAFARWLHATILSEGEAGRSGDAVTIGTFHSAKGLEWPIVHLAGIEDGYVPIAHARTPASRAEEARLLYVAMTRAQRQLRITWARQRTFGTKVVERLRSPLLAPLMGHGVDPTVAGEPASATTVAPPVPDWSEHVAAQRAALAVLSRSGPPGLEGLHAWRESTARAARVEPTTVLPDHVLQRVTRVRPRTVEELAGVRGVGPILAGRFGEAILAALHDTGGER